VLRVRAKSEHQAAKIAFDEIDLNRAIWNILGNSSMEWGFGSEFRPINKVRLGRIHTVHNLRDKDAAPSVWTEPNFVPVPIYSPQLPDVFRENAKKLQELLAIANYKAELQKALLLYVRALDEQDPSNALIKLWTAQELLTCPPGVADHERVVDRSSFLFRNKHLHRQILNHLRERRNKLVHSGFEGSQTKICCYQLQGYFRKLFYFHNSNHKLFNSLQEANEFLDLPTEVKELERRARVLDHAKEFVSEKPKA
jgi:hypothetical protein